MARILVIDDDKSLLKMMKIMLEKGDHEALVANSGSEGIEMAQTQQPDLAIVDVMMPGMSGYEVCRQLRENAATMNIPLLILTARSQPMDRQMASEAGADGFVTKPVTRDELYENIEYLLASGATNFPAPAAAEPPPTTTAPPAAPAPPPPAITAPVIAVIGVSKQVGTTTLAVNLALGAMQHGRSCVVDLNDSSSHVASQLQLSPPDRSWVNLLGVGAQVSGPDLGNALLMHNSGVAVMPAPATPAPYRLPIETVAPLFGVLSEGFKRIVVDLPQELSDTSVAALRAAKHILIVTSDAGVVLQGAGVELQALDALGLPVPQHFVLNRSTNSQISFPEAQRALGRQIDFELPHEPNQSTALAQGQPLIMSQPASAFSQAVLEIARAL